MCTGNFGLKPVLHKPKECGQPPGTKQSDRYHPMAHRLTPIRAVSPSHTHPWPPLAVFALHGLLYGMRHPLCDIRLTKPMCYVYIAPEHNCYYHYYYYYYYYYRNNSVFTT